MHVNVTFRHVDPSDPLREYATDKTERLAKYLLEPVEVHWVLSVQKIRHTAAATVTANGLRIKAQEETEDLYSAIDSVLDKLENQVRKHKEKAKDHHKTDHAEARTGEMEKDEPVASEASSSSGELARVVTTRNVFIKPMSVEEATMQMDVADNDFLVFTNSSTNNVNVLYSRKDGNYGLIETITK
ncbi:MAG: ribosome-associated translation inhibitor RaiA [Thermodesulfobacteriota bacterium]